MSRLAPRWVRTQLSAEEAEAAAELARLFALSPVVARVLVHRGISTIGQARDFLDPGLDSLHSPALLLGIGPALARLQSALAKRESILLYGDYDVDGTSAIVILKTVLDLLGAQTAAFVPHRLRDGYGMKASRIEEAAREGVRLIVSVDTGIRAGEVVSLASRLGMDTIVTDHHLPEAEIPPAVAVLNPNQPGCAYPNKHLCGAGVAFKLAQALLAGSALAAQKQERLLESLLKIACLATIADIVPLTGENRAIVKLGLAGLADVRQPGLRALLDVSGIVSGVAPTSRQIAFQVAPRINAAGRMASAEEVLALFFTRDAAFARRIAAALDEMNRQRQDTEKNMREAIETQLRRDPAFSTRLGLVLYQPDWHLGVAGIVAGRIAEQERKPTFVLTRQENDGSTTVKGSGRSIPGFHLLDALESMRDLFEQFGGHEQAAGLTLEEARVPAFAEAFAAAAARALDEETRRPRIEIDAEISAADLTSGLFDAVQRLAPFGYRHQPPTFALYSATVAAPPVAMKAKHLKLQIQQSGHLVTVKGWSVPPEWFQLSPGDRVDVVCQLEHDSYDGWAAILKDLRRA
ncbi:MAG: single-stranded-DNA-specific exonuclease RecJ [Acidobacteriota bacterium]